MTRPTSSLEALKLFMEGSKVLAQIERNGVKIHVERLDKTISKTEKEIRRIAAELKKDPIFALWRREYGNNAKLSSNPQLADILYNKMGIQCKKETKKGNPSVDEESLQDVDHPFVRKLFEMRHLDKTVNTFLKGIRREAIDGVVHPFYHLHTVVTMRSSSSDPNWQNLPKRNPHLSKLVRRCIVAREGNYLWELDFKGIEVSIAAVVSGDKTLREYVSDKKKDMHRDMAAQIFMLEQDQVTKGIRNLAKQYFVFAQFYGDYYKQCAKNLWENTIRENQKLADGTPLIKYLKDRGFKEMGECDHTKDTVKGTFESHLREVEDDFWNRRFKGYAEWKKKWWNDYQENGYFITPTGFLIKWGKAGLLTKNEANNNPIQGPAFHCNLWTLIRLSKWLDRNKMKTLLTGQIHDSEIGESPLEEIQEVFNEVTRITREDLPKHFKWISVPMEIEISVSNIGESWYDLKEWKKNENGIWAQAA